MSSWRQSWRAGRDRFGALVVSLALAVAVVTEVGLGSGFARVGITLALTAGLVALLESVGWASGRLRR